jgi:endonuclease/exonuclease/phosphatase family metal-dependent hydrolase
MPEARPGSEQEADRVRPDIRAGGRVVSASACHPPRRPRRHARLCGIALCMLASALLAVPPAAQAKGSKVKVMTRNLYLGADLTPGVEATSLQQLVNAAGEILNQVDVNDFPTRARGLAAEIRTKKPDLVGMQEVALWRDAPCTEFPIPPEAIHVRYDFLQLLLDRLNRKGARYRVVVSEPEFDFEIWANTDGDESTGAPFGCDINGRLTMRDVILARTRHVETQNAAGGHFEHLLTVNPAGVPIPVTRGWTEADARVGHGRWFHFVNTHLEAFDDETQHPSIRALQAQELVAPGGPATSDLPVVLVGDLNSDDDTVSPDDAQAYNVLLDAGFRERSTDDPLSCCLESADLRVGHGGSISDFDHQVDHVMTDSPAEVELANSFVTGLRPVNGFWDSDHAGLFSALLLR